MKRRLFGLRLLSIALIFFGVVTPVLAKPGESKGRQKERFGVLFDGDISGAGTAEVVNQWGMGIYGKQRITLTFSGDWYDEPKEDPIDFAGIHENCELGLHTKDKGLSVRMNIGFKMGDYQHAFVLEATGTVEGTWMEDSFSIEFIDTPATVRYKRSRVWDGIVTFTIECNKVPA